MGLTHSIIAMIYGSEKPKLKITFRQLQKPFEIESETLTVTANYEQVVYYWYQFLQLIMKNTVGKVPTDPEICTELVKAFASLADEFLGFTLARNSKSKTGFAYSENIGHADLGRLLASFNLSQRLAAGADLGKTSGQL